MLNKEICKKCKTKNFSGWKKSDEKSWESGVVYCYFKEDVFCYAFIKNPPRKNCYYKLEHLLKEDK
jgi:hypothetical protein